MAATTSPATGRTYGVRRVCDLGRCAILILRRPAPGGAAARETCRAARPETGGRRRRPARRHSPGPRPLAVGRRGTPQGLGPAAGNRRHPGQPDPRAAWLGVSLQDIGLGLSLVRSAGKLKTPGIAGLKGIRLAGLPIGLAGSGHSLTCSVTVCWAPGCIPGSSTGRGGVYWSARTAIESCSLGLTMAAPSTPAPSRLLMAARSRRTTGLARQRDTAARQLAMAIHGGTEHHLRSRHGRRRKHVCGDIGVLAAKTVRQCQAGFALLQRQEDVALTAEVHQVALPVPELAAQMGFRGR